MQRNLIANNKVTEILEAFLSEKPRKKVWGNFRIEDNRLIYKTYLQECCRMPYDVSEKEKMEFIEKIKKLKIIESKSGTLKEILYKINSEYSPTVYYLKEAIDVIAIKTQSDKVLGNSSILPLIVAYSVYGNYQENISVTKIQLEMERSGNFIMIPFFVFEQAKLDLNDFEIVDQSKAEEVRVRIHNPRYNTYDNTAKKLPEYILETRHFTGASLFKVENQYFLFDVDRNEIKHNIFNPFLVNLPKACKTISEAYEMLKPPEVKKAERAGKAVLRQGEWFFIPVKKPKEVKSKYNENEMLLGLVNARWTDEKFFKSLYGEKQYKKLMAKVKKYGQTLVKPVKLQAGTNSPNNAQLGITNKEGSFVTGKIEHSGREHHTIILKSWYKAIPNTATKSFTITGDID